jgi:hypothetical protein
MSVFERKGNVDRQEKCHGGGRVLAIYHVRQCLEKSGRLTLTWHTMEHQSIMWYRAFVAKSSGNNNTSLTGFRSRAFTVDKQWTVRCLHVGWLLDTNWSPSHGRPAEIIFIKTYSTCFDNAITMTKHVWTQHILWYHHISTLSNIVKHYFWQTRICPNMSNFRGTQNVPDP